MKKEKITYCNHTNIKKVFFCAVCLGIVFFMMPISILTAENNHIGHKTGSPKLQCVEPDAAEHLLFELINNARKNPMEAVLSSGMNWSEVIEDNDDISDILKDGLQPLKFSKILYINALEHTDQMLKNNYFSYESIDGKNLKELLSREGYEPIEAGKALGMLSFSNYIAKKRAVYWLFENMLKDELTSNENRNLRIFSPVFKEMAVAVNGGQFEIGKHKANVYIASCNFGKPANVWELELLNLINQVRSNPWPVLAEYGINEKTTNSLLFDVLIDKGFEPLKFDTSLYIAAETLVADMFENHHFDELMSDNKTLEDRVEEAKYQNWAWVGETKGRFSTCDEKISPSQSVDRIFQYLLNRALKNNPENQECEMLIPWAQDAGIRIAAGESKVLGGVCGENLHILVADFGAKIQPDKSILEEGKQESEEISTGRLIGLVYDDKNLNGIYDSQEGLSGARVELYRDGILEAWQCTNIAGGFSIELLPGEYRIEVKGTSENDSAFVEVFSGKASWIQIKSGKLLIPEDEVCDLENTDDGT